MLPAAEGRYRFARQVTAIGVRQARKIWGRLNLDAIDTSAVGVVRDLTALTTGLQLLQAHGSDAYVHQALVEQGDAADPEGTVSPAAFAGVASDGRDLSSLLHEPVIHTLAGIVQGRTAQEAAASAWFELERILATQLADAGRVATGVAITSRPKTQGWVRVLNPPSCPGCAELAGRWYRWSSGFDRHPGCDCVNMPASEVGAADHLTDPMEAFRAGQVRGLSKADTQAIQDGADFSKVVNAHRKGMTFASGGQRFTREAAHGGPRLMPESIYKIAGDDRAEAIRLLKAHGFII